MDEVTVLGIDLKEFYDGLEEKEKKLFFTLLAVGKSAEYARDYIGFIGRNENWF